MPAKPPRAKLSESDVSALFAGKAISALPAWDKCDNCAIMSADCLEFGGTSGFEMPIDAGGPLDLELRLLRRRHARESILLCYGCTDALQAPPGGLRTPQIALNNRRSTESDTDTPRLFAVK